MMMGHAHSMNSMVSVATELSEVHVTHRLSLMMHSLTRSQTLSAGLQTQLLQARQQQPERQPTPASPDTATATGQHLSSLSIAIANQIHRLYRRPLVHSCPLGTHRPRLQSLPIPHQRCHLQCALGSFPDPTKCRLPRHRSSHLVRSHRHHHQHHHQVHA